MNAQDIQRGFNSGYTLKTQTPDLADRFAKVLSGREDGYAVGFLAGVKEREKEVLISKQRHYNIGKSTRPAKSRLKDKNKDKDHRDI